MRRTRARKKPVAAKVSISLPSDLLRTIDRHADKRGETRSEFIRSAIERVLRQELERKEVGEWLESYRSAPHTDCEAGWAVLGLGVLSDNPWDDDPKTAGA